MSWSLPSDNPGKSVPVAFQIIDCKTNEVMFTTDFAEFLNERTADKDFLRHHKLAENWLEANYPENDTYVNWNID